MDEDSVIHAERALRYSSKILESGFNTRSILEAQRTLDSGVVWLTISKKKFYIFIVVNRLVKWSRMVNHGVDHFFIVRGSD